jgi:hypothetical protein
MSDWIEAAKTIREIVGQEGIDDLAQANREWAKFERDKAACRLGESKYGQCRYNCPHSGPDCTPTYCPMENQ